MDKERHEKEIGKRERLVQTFLIIAGFLVVNSGQEKIKENIILPIFSFFLFTIILYYIFLTRTKLNFGINAYAYVSSFLYSIFIFVFFYSHSPAAFTYRQAIFLMVMQTLIITFSLLAPETSDNVIWSFKREITKHRELLPPIRKHRELLSISLLILSVLLVILFYIL